MTSTKISNERFPIRLTDSDLTDLVHGADWHWSFAVYEDDNVTPLDTTGWTLAVTIMESENGETYLSLSNGSGVTMTAASGLFVIDITDTQVDALNFTRAVIKMVMTDDTGDKTPFFLGTIKFAQV